MPGPLINFLFERIRERQDQNAWLRHKQIRRGHHEGAAQYKWRKTEKYDFSQRPAKKVPFFGSNTNEGLALDWASDEARSIRVPIQSGKAEGVSSPTRRRLGNTANIAPLVLYGKSDVQETRRSLSYQGTDQKPIIGRRSSGASWDGLVRNIGTRRSYLSARRKPELTPGDIIAREMKDEIYSFF